VTLADTYATDDETIRYDADAAGGETPFLVPATDARDPPQRVHDDAMLLAALLEEIDADDPSALDTDSLTDLYVLASDVQHGSDRLRRSAREPLLERIGADQRLSRTVRHGETDDAGTPPAEGRRNRVRRPRRARHPREWVTGIDREKMDVVLAVTDLEENEVYDVDEDVYVQKTGVDEDEKYSRDCRGSPTGSTTSRTPRARPCARNWTTSKTGSRRRYRPDELIETVGTVRRSRRLSSDSQFG